jgi:hypothetical protein
LGRKVRSIHPVRPFNRQVACSGQSAGQGNRNLINPENQFFIDTPTVNQRERSNAFSDDLDDKDEIEQLKRSDEIGNKDFEDVNDAIMPMEELEEGGVIIIKNNKLN